VNKYSGTRKPAGKKHLIQPCCPEYMAFSPPILGERRVLAPHTLAKEHAIQCITGINRAVADTDLARIDGSNPEYTAHMPSTLRYVS
jgi:hypothetical protein